MSKIEQLLKLFFKENGLEVKSSGVNQFISIMSLKSLISFIVQKKYEGEIGVSILINTGTGIMELLEGELIIDINSKYKSFETIKFDKKSLWSTYVKENLDRKILVPLERNENLLSYCDNYISHIKHIVYEDYNLGSDDLILVEIF